MLTDTAILCYWEKIIHSVRRWMTTQLHSHGIVRDIARKDRRDIRAFILQNYKIMLREDC